MMTIIKITISCETEDKLGIINLIYNAVKFTEYQTVSINTNTVYREI
jgi:hypothetical protein